MNDRYLRTLELDKILLRLADHASFSAGRELALALRPTASESEVAARLRETSEAKHLLSIQPGVSLGGARDIRAMVRNAVIGATLDPAALLDVQATLASGKALRRAIVQPTDKYPTLAAIARGIDDCPRLCAEITRCISPNAEVVDSASPALSRMRRALSVARDRLLDRLGKLMVSPEYANSLQEALVTQRGGRYVIPVRAEHKGRIPGIVHDQSTSGATLFVEPLAIVELGNEWRQLQLDEQREVERILQELSGIVAEHAPALQATVEALSRLDLALAKANYAFATGAVCPELLHGVRENKPTEDGGQKYPDYLNLVRARHPLLPADKVVPIDVQLGSDFAALVITGPNTGGKTVALKTVGLLTAMAQTGLHIPSGDGSSLRVFSGIFADIGDEQSIEQSLSTFSSHMSTIVNILKEADEGSLVLLDELGAGTDPTEGAALAQAILSELLKRAIPAMATTHYAELKLFAQTTPGVTNASVEFDIKTLSPTFKLTIGLPGRSNAFAIASRLGLPGSIIEQARATIASGDLEADRILDRIRQSRHEAGRAASAAQQSLSAAREREKEARRLVREAEQERHDLLAEARDQLDTANEELKCIRVAAEKEQITRKWLEEAEQRLRKIEQKQKAAQPVQAQVKADPRLKEEPLAVGDTVWISTLRQLGQVIALADGDAEVQVGLFRAKVPLTNLEKRAPAAVPTDTHIRVALAARPSPGLELHIRGQRVDEALPQIGKYLDDAFLAGLPFVRIVHGKGTGTLRRVVRETLSTHPLVASFRDAELREGGEGATVVTLVGRTAER